MSEETCDNCGLPSGSIVSAGHSFSLETRPTSAYQHRSTKHRVWSCSRECGIQSLARNKYGEASYKWPVTLAEFRQLEGEPFFRGLTVTKYPPQTRINTGSDEGLFEKVALPPTEGFRNASGRPKRHISAAARQRAYRERQRATA